jgi:hypothetical protein
MKTIINLIIAASCIASVSAFAVTSADLYGSAAKPGFEQRTIVVDSHTRHVNVKHGETVTLSNGANSVSWHFDGIRSAIPLSKILPATAVGQEEEVEVYVEPEPLG